MAAVGLEVARETDVPQVLEALAAQGLEGEVDGERRIVVEVDGEPEEIDHLLELSLAGGSLPLVAVRVDGTVYLRPYAD